jgi:predicted AlkP superfamily pyrophosphatase or phosphodiesterase
MRQSPLVAALILLFSWGVAATAAEPSSGPVLVISEDGLGADQFRPDTMPRLWELAEGGRRSAVRPPFPSTTFDGHVTLATGCWPEHHGVVANSYFRAEDHRRVPVAHRAEDILREPLWVAATRSGVKTAVYHWVGATGPWDGITPWRMETFRLGPPDTEGMAFCDAALAQGAHLVMAYLSGSDAEGHIHGPQSSQLRQKLKRLDQELAPWLKRLLATYPGLRIILTADHGMAGMKHRINLPSLLKGIPAELISHGGSAYVYLKNPDDLPSAMAKLQRAGLTVWRRDQVPVRYHLGGSPRVGDLVVVAPLGTWLSQAETPGQSKAERRGRAGAHAYTPENDSMRAWLLVLGMGQGPLKEVQAWDIAPTVGRWLGVHWAQEPDGQPVPELVSGNEHQ